MAEYSFKPSDVTTEVNWDDPSVWSGGVVPNNPEADVDFPTVTYISSGEVYQSYITILTGEQFSTHSVDLRDGLFVSGTLNVGANLTDYANGGYIGLNDGTIVAGTIVNSAEIQGSGLINVSSLVNSSFISGSYSYDTGQSTTINAGSLNNTGTITGPVHINVTPGNFSQLSGSTITGGSYEISSGDPGVQQSSIMAFNVGAVISTNAAILTLDGGVITSHDPVSGQDIPITTSLTTIAPTGTLNISQNYNFGSLTVQGHVTLSGNAHFGASALTVAPGGTLQGYGTVTTPIVNDGRILAASYNSLVFNEAITGTGYLEVSSSSGLLELKGGSAQNVILDGNYSALKIDSTLSFHGSITPIGSNNIVVLSGVSASSIIATTYTGDTHGGMLTLQQAGGSTLSLQFNGSFTQSSFSVQPGPQLLSSDTPSVAVSINSSNPPPPVCFCSGTRILTPIGERLVESLSVGELVITSSGTIKTIQWIGSGTRIVMATDPRTRPVIVRANALADSVPCRDLRVTEGHSLFLDGMLVPVSALINGRTIMWDDAARSVTFYHVELPDHDVLVADGAPMESYRNDGNRCAFSGAEGGHPSLMTSPFAPVLRDGPAVDALWESLVARAGGPVSGLTPDPDLNLVIAGRRHDPISVENGLYRFIVRSIKDDVQIVSRAATPALTGLARDMRSLGVAVRSIEVLGTEKTFRLEYDSPFLRDGFHAAEPSGRIRWTTGQGTLPAALFMSETWLTITVEVACLTSYALVETNSTQVSRQAV